MLLLQDAAGVSNRVTLPLDPSKKPDVGMVKASVSGAVDSGLIPRRVGPMTIKLVFTAFLLDLRL